MAENDEVLGFFCFDLAQFNPTALGFPRVGAFRAQWLIECVSDLQKNLYQSLEIRLYIACGSAVNEICSLAAAHGIAKVYVQQEITSEEKMVTLQVQKALQQHGHHLIQTGGSTMFHPQDLPFSIKDLPPVFTDFRKRVEKQCNVRPLVTIPAPKSSISLTDYGAIPSLDALGICGIAKDKRSAVPFQGGETAGLTRLKQYLWETNKVQTYKETRNQMLGPDYSSKFSLWLACGSLSPKMIYFELMRYQQEVKENEDTYWVFFELLWRDYFKFIALKYGDRIFSLDGYAGRRQSTSGDLEKFHAWRAGETSNAFINAQMNELKHTGFMSNRGRQNVASYLIHDLRVHWTWGATYFESKLIDYDPCSNWGNWAYLAGVGADPRPNRYFNVAKQAATYDPDGEYVKTWSE